MLLLVGCADSTATIGSEPRCPECRIVLRHVADLGSAEDEDSPSTVFKFARLSDGRIVVVPMTDLSSIGVYSASGVLERRHGRRGEGPGEFTYAWDVNVLARDTLLLVDAMQNRYTVVSPSFETVGVVNLDPSFAPRGMVAISSDELVTHAEIVRARRARAAPGRGRPRRRLVR